MSPVVLEEEGKPGYGHGAEGAGLLRNKIKVDKLPVALETDGPFAPAGKLRPEAGERAD